MMNPLKKSFALLLALVLCLGLAACGGGDEKPEEDWRDSAQVVDRGSITRDDGSVDVLVIMNDAGAYFYLDEPEQEMYGCVAFPEEITDAQQYLDGGVSFDDIDGDGNSDVSLGFVYAPGDSTSLVWFWDPENEFFSFQEDQSVLDSNSGDIGDYVGLWEYANGGSWIRINEDETWECLNEFGNVFQSGTLELDDTGVMCYDSEGSESVHLDRTVSGDLINSEEGGLIVLANGDPFAAYVDIDGKIVDRETITHGGLDSMDVLVAVDTYAINFYEDRPGYEYYTSATYPIPIPDAIESFSGMSFDDLNGDGESDFMAYFNPASGEGISVIWVWDSEAEDYVPQME